MFTDSQKSALQMLKGNDGKVIDDDLAPLRQDVLKSLYELVELGYVSHKHITNYPGGCDLYKLTEKGKAVLDE